MNKGSRGPDLVETWKVPKMTKNDWNPSPSLHVFGTGELLMDVDIQILDGYARIRCDRLFNFHDFQNFKFGISPKLLLRTNSSVED